MAVSEATPVATRLLKHLPRRLAGNDSDDILFVVSALSLAILVFHGFSHGYFTTAFQLVFVAFLLAPGLRTRGAFWFVIACLGGAAIYLDWSTADNHKYLLFYWSVALFLVFEQPRDRRLGLLLDAARYLLFFTMFFAVAQKTLSPDYLSGDFFTSTLLTDSRFQYLTALLTDYSIAELRNIRTVHSAMLDPVNIGIATVLEVRPGLRALALAITWINYIDQILIALLVLAPLPRRWQVAKHIALMAFIVPVYLVAPVIGFGWLIVVWGYCLVPQNLPLLRLMYVGLFFLLGLFGVPWLGFLV